MKILGEIQLDIPAGRYSAPGRPDIETVVAILTAETRLIESWRKPLEDFLASLDERQRKHHASPSVFCYVKAAFEAARARGRGAEFGVVYRNRRAAGEPPERAAWVASESLGFIHMVGGIFTEIDGKEED